ncbi:hypothetical protein ABIA30_003582 [Mycobacterium sp. MAA66]
MNAPTTVAMDDLALTYSLVTTGPSHSVWCSLWPPTYELSRAGVVGWWLTSIAVLLLLGVSIYRKARPTRVTRVHS